MSVNTSPGAAGDARTLPTDKTRIVVGVLIFAALTALTARFSFRLPFTPVPITLQVLAVLLAGLVLGARGGAASQLTYLGMIAVGLPFTASGLAGPAAFFSPTAGYLLAFVPAAFVVGALARPGWRTVAGRARRHRGDLRGRGELAGGLVGRRLDQGMDSGCHAVYRC